MLPHTLHGAQSGWRTACGDSVLPLQKRTLTVHGKRGTHRQTYWVANELPQEQRTLRLVSGEKSKPKSAVVAPKDRVSIHYGLLFSKKANAGVEHMISAVGKVHNVPDSLYKVPIKVTGSLGGAQGVYKLWKPFGGNEICVSRWAQHPSATAAHEYGHFLDHHLFGTGKSTYDTFASERWAARKSSNSEVAPVMLALYRSDAAKQLVAQHRDHERTGDLHGRRYTRYLLEPPEIFARAYAQYIGLRASKEIQQGTLDYGEHWRRHGYHAQWDDKDFEPIAREFDRLFQRRGLLRHRRTS